MRKPGILSFSLIIWIALLSEEVSSQPIRLSKENPHYFFYQGKPTILITSAEHYGAVVNNAFNYNLYLDWLHTYGLNYTRIYPGGYFELPDKWSSNNTLGIPARDLILPWARSNLTGSNLGGNKFNLDQWNISFFNRLHDFIERAATSGIIVEICLFNVQYKDSWPIHPFFKSNNIQGTGADDFLAVQTLDDSALLRRQTDYVRKITQEVNKYDNVILELCDEPILHHESPIAKTGQWLDYLIGVIHNTEKALPKKHLLAQQVEGTSFNGPCDFLNDPRINLITTQYLWRAYGNQIGGLKAIDSGKYALGKPIELNETYYYPEWYAGDSIAGSRTEAWEFMVAGGTSFNQLNGRYTVANPSGNTPDNAKVCANLKVLKDFLYSFNFLRMAPDIQFLRSVLPMGVFCRATSWPGNQYALYLHHSNYIIRNDDSAAYKPEPGIYRHQLVCALPAGTYRVEWIRPETGAIITGKIVKHVGGYIELATPQFMIDIALRIKRIGKPFTDHPGSVSKKKRATDIVQNKSLDKRVTDEKD